MRPKLKAAGTVTAVLISVAILPSEWDAEKYVVWSAGKPAAAAEPKPAVKEMMLFDFEEEALKAWSNLTPADAKVKDPDVKLERLDKHATSGKHSLKLTFAGGHFPTVTSASPIADWTGCKAFKADVTA